MSRSHSPPLEVLESERYMKTEKGQSLMSAMNQFVQAVKDMDETIMVPCRLKDIPAASLSPASASGNSSTALVPAVSPRDGDLYTFYTMLNVIKADLVRGEIAGKGVAAVEESDDSGQDESQDAQSQAKETASMFRYHLRGLFDVLKQMTDTARELTKRYQEEVGDSNRIYSSV